MIKKVKVEGLDCPNCAKTLENELKKLQGVKSAELNFVGAYLRFESDDVESTLNEIIKLTKKIEPDVKITDDLLESVTGESTAKACHRQDNGKTKLCCKASATYVHHAENEKHQAGFECSCNHSDHCHGKKKNAILIDMLLLGLGVALGIISLFITQNIALHYVLLLTSVICLGWKTYLKAFRLLTRGVVNENLLLTISVFGAMAIGKDMESVMVIALYSIGKILEGLAVNKSRKSIEKITNFKPEFAVVLRNGQEHKIAPNEALLGEVIVIRPGECVPIDAEIIEGQTSLGMQSLTGESLPTHVKIGDKILSGSIVLDGVIKAKTTALYEDSTVSKILNLIENNQQKKSKAETVISKVTKWYTLGVIILSLLTFGVVFLVTSSFQTAFYRGLIFLVISCPCAFAISVPLSYFSGLGNASKNGILIKGTIYLDECARIKTIVFDKTGTLTTGKFSINKVDVIDKRLSEKDVLKIAGIGEQYSIHPLAVCITESVEGVLPQAKNVKEIAGEGVYFSYNGKDYFVGRRTKNLAQTCVEVFENSSLLARIYLSDSIKATSGAEIAKLKKMGVKTVLLSGDKQGIVEKIAQQIGVAEFKSELLPHEKSIWIEDEIKKTNSSVAFVGDGLNDAPSLTIANVGFCMGLGGNPASIEASDIVLSDDNPSKISKAIKISKFTRKIVWQNIFFSAFIKLLFLTLGAVGVTGMLSAVIADVGVTVLAVLNSLRALNYKVK